MRRIKILLVVTLIIMLSNGVFAQVRGIPVDIPGTGINFFLYRYEGNSAPHDKVNAIWANLSVVFSQWVESGKNPDALKGEDVKIKTNSSGSVNIYVKDQFIVEVDQYHAKINLASPIQLAEKWATNLRKGVDKFVAINASK